MGKPVKISNIPPSLINFTRSVAGIFSKQTADLLAFFSTAMQTENVAPQYGTHKLKDYYREMLKILD